MKGGPVLLDDVELYLAESVPTAPAARSAVLSKQTPLTTLTTMPQQPTIDGVVNAPEWASASTAAGFFVQGGESQAPRQSIVHVGFDEKNLYVAFESRQDALMIKEVKPAKDVQFGNDHEAFELWFKPTGKRFYQLLVLPGGATIIKSEDASLGNWSPNLKYVSKVTDSGEMHGGILSLGKKYWAGEIAIPFADLGLTAPQDGDTWRMNFTRDFSTIDGKARAEADWTTWSPISLFSDVKNYGYVQFDRKAAPFKVTSFGDLANGSMNIQGANSAAVDLRAFVAMTQYADKALLSRDVNRAETGAFEVKGLIKSAALGVSRMNLLFSA